MNEKPVSIDAPKSIRTKTFARIGKVKDQAQLQISIALIKRYDANQKPMWLSLWDSRHDHFDFISSQRLENESFRESILREVAWQLNVDRKSLLVSNMAQLSLEFIAQLPGESQQRPIAIAFYNVELYGKRTRDEIENLDEIRWLTSIEVCEGQSADGKSISPKLSFLIRKSQVIQEWESR